MPESDEDKKKGAFILKYEGINASTEINMVVKRLRILREVLDRAVREGNRVWGQKLRQSAAIMLYIDAHQEVRRMLRPRGEEALLSKKQRWMGVAKRARKVIDVQLRHAETVIRLRSIKDRIDAGDDAAFEEVPEEFPQKAMYVRYLRPLFGESYKLWELLLKKRQIHARQAALNAVKQELTPKESPVPLRPLEESNERKHDKKA